jgi:SAM-dependent methyltransferase
MTSVTEFYDRLSPIYHLVYHDWEASVRRQASQLDGLIREIWDGGVQTILDAACGIGTQALGLAGLGYRVTAADISPTALARAGEEARKRGLVIPFAISDLRTLSTVHHGPFDLVLACDNAIPHLLSDDEIRQAFREMYGCVRPGGGCLISVRDYQAGDSGTKLIPYGVRREGDRRHVVFQIWEFTGAMYDLSMYFVEDTGEDECVTRVLRTRYYAVPVARLMELMTEAGFSAVRRIDGRFFQPVIVGLRATEPAGDRRWRPDGGDAR